MEGGGLRLTLSLSLEWLRRRGVCYWINLEALALEKIKAFVSEQIELAKEVTKGMLFVTYFGIFAVVLTILIVRFVVQPLYEVLW